MSAQEKISKNKQKDKTPKLSKGEQAFPNCILRLMHIARHGSHKNRHISNGRISESKKTMGREGEPFYYITHSFRSCTSTLQRKFIDTFQREHKYGKGITHFYMRHTNTTLCIFL